MNRPTLPHGLLLAALLAPTLMPTPAAAHAHLQNSQPAEGVSATVVPDLRLLYTEAVNLNRSTIALHSAAGQDVPLPPLTSDLAEPMAVLLHLPQPLSPGAYTVEWHAVAAGNGHRTAGTYAFNVGDTAPGQTAAIRAEQPWARATAPQQKVGGAYVTLISPADDRLVSISSPVAGRAEVHEMRMDGNVMRMRELTDGLLLPAGKAVALAPGGYHIMLMDLKQPLVAGQVIPVQLRFQTAPTLDLQVQVAPIGAGSPPGPGASAPPGLGGRGAISGHVH